MRKTLLAAALSCALCPLLASAQTSVAVIPPRSLATGDSRVELHGLVDVGVESINNGGGNTARLSSGIGAGSRLGIRGSEDMGGGYRAIFELEMRLEVDNGSQQSSSSFVSQDLPAGTFPAGTSPTVVNAATPTVVAGQQSLQRLVTTVNRDNALFDRQAFMGVVTPYGAFLGGRMYTAGYEILNAFNAFGDATAGQMGQGFSNLTIRVNNALAYRARFFDKLVTTLMYSFGGSETIGGGRSERTNAPTGSDDFYGANLRWTSDNFDVGAGYNRINTLNVVTNQSVKGLETINLGASYKFSGLRVFAQGMKRKNDNPIFVGLPTPATAAQFASVQPLLSYQDADLVVGQAGRTDTVVYHLGATYEISPGVIAAAVNKADDRRPENADVMHYALGYFHGLSRRTTLYTVAAYADNKGPARMALGSAGFSGGFTEKTGDASKVLQIGLRHSF